jgi:hypothetical protein
VLPHRKLLAALAVGVMLVLAACGGDDDDSASTTAAAADEEETTTTTESDDDGEGEGDDENDDESASGDVIIEESFDDDSNDWAPEALDDEFATGEISNGFMTFSVSQSLVEGLPEGQASVPALVWPTAIEDDAEDFEHIRVETTVSFTEGGVAGLACGVDPSGQDLRTYFFSLSSSGVLAISEFTEDEVLEQLVRLPEDDDSGETGFDYDEDDVYELAVECEGDEDGTELTMELDGEEVLSTTDTTDPIEAGVPAVHYTESAILTNENGFEPFGIAFDDFVVTDLSG